MRFYQLLLLILIGLHLKTSQALVTYQSTLLLNATKPDAGLKLIKGSIKKDTNFEKGITICLRFNFLALGSFIFSHDTGPATDRQLMIGTISGYWQTLFIFGTTILNVKDVESDTFLLWSTNRWHSICLAFDRTNSHITFVKVLECIMYCITVGILHSAFLEQWMS